MPRPMPPPPCTPRARASAGWSSWCSRSRHWQVLDVATGAGHTAAAFAPHVARAVASDLTAEMLQEAAKLAKAKGLANMETARADAEALPFDDGQLRSRHLPHRPASFSGRPDLRRRGVARAEGRRHIRAGRQHRARRRVRRRASPAPSCATRR